MPRRKKEKKIKPIDSGRIIGGSGFGKSKYLQFLIESKVQKGEPFTVIDPKGKSDTASQKTLKKPRKQKR